jgi:phosphoribosylformylglycinamidine cyclo-ligase
MGEVIKGHAEGTGVDLVGMCVGLVPLEKVNTGQEVTPGDLILGLSSSGIHSNGLTLARRVLFDQARLDPAGRAADLERSPAEELLEPTRIYVRLVRELGASGVPLKAMIHITGDGLLNLGRIQPALSFRSHTLPEPQPIFRMIQRLGSVTDAEMYRVFNMGVGFCILLPPDEAGLARAREICRDHGVETTLMGEVTADPSRKVILEPKGLVGEGEAFRSAG